MNSRQKLGQQGERIAMRYLRKQGYTILERNYRCKLGEIDIIAQKGNLLVFIEVKTRNSRRYGLPQEAVHKRKRETLQKVAWYYLKSRKKSLNLRFDCIAIILDQASGSVSYFNHIQNIFL